MQKFGFVQASKVIESIKAREETNMATYETFAAVYDEIMDDSLTTNGPILAYGICQRMQRQF